MYVAPERLVFPQFRQVLRRLEDLRTAGGIGSSLQAEVQLRVSGEDHDLLATLGDDLRFVFITSAASVAAGNALQTTPTPFRGGPQGTRALARRAQERAGTAAGAGAGHSVATAPRE